MPEQGYRATPEQWGQVEDWEGKYGNRGWQGICLLDLRSRIDELTAEMKALKASLAAAPALSPAEAMARAREWTAYDAQQAWKAAVARGATFEGYSTWLARQEGRS